MLPSLCFKEEDERRKEHTETIDLSRGDCVRVQRLREEKALNMRSEGTCIKHIVRMDGGGLLMTTETLMWSDCRSADD